ncbi:MAG: hypothetical protein RSA24_03205 [Clostridia bacterium]
MSHNKEESISNETENNTNDVEILSNEEKMQKVSQNKYSICFFAVLSLILIICCLVICTTKISYGGRYIRLNDNKEQNNTYIYSYVFDKNNLYKTYLNGELIDFGYYVVDKNTLYLADGDRPSAFKIVSHSKFVLYNDLYDDIVYKNQNVSEGFLIASAVFSSIVLCSLLIYRNSRSFKKLIKSTSKIKKS